jgi:hypothetical protein
MEHSEELEPEEFLAEQKRKAIKRVVFWLLVLAAVVFLIMFGMFSLFDTIAQTITGIL